MYMYRVRCNYAAAAVSTGRGFTRFVLYCIATIVVIIIMIIIICALGVMNPVCVPNTPAPKPLK